MTQNEMVEWLVANQQTVQQWAFQCGVPWQDTEDIFQELCLITPTMEHNFRGTPEQFWRYAKTCVCRLAWRERHRRKDVVMENIDPIDLTDPSEIAEENETLSAVQDFVQTLDTIPQTCFAQYYFSQIVTRKIAANVGRSKSCVSYHNRRNFRKLQSLLRERMETMSNELELQIQTSETDGMIPPSLEHTTEVVIGELELDETSNLPFDEIPGVEAGIIESEAFVCDTTEPDIQSDENFYQWTQRPMMTQIANIVYDIETGPLPDEELRLTWPGVEVSKVKDFDLIGRDFDPSDVKVGNLKDQNKINEKIQNAREDFEKRRNAAVLALDKAEEDQFADYKAHAALSALTGQVLAIGMGLVGEDGKVQEIAVFQQSEVIPERVLLQRFFDLMATYIRAGVVFVGHNNLKFDNLFLLRRSWANGLMVPDNIVADMAQYRPSYFVDTMKEWGDSIKLDTLAQFLRVTRKNGDGALFHTLFHGTPEEHQQAVDYLKNDIRMTSEVAERLGVFRG